MNLERLQQVIGRHEDPVLLLDILRIAEALVHCAKEVNEDAAVAVAMDARRQYIRRLRIPDALVMAKALPVAKAVMAGDGDGRYYWRIRRTCGTIVPAVKFPDKNTGTLALARSAAMELFLNGGDPVELIPPDIDPQRMKEQEQENRSGFQPAGMTVRQREKKH